VRFTARDAVIAVAAVAAGAALTIAFGERIAINNGIGWDGQAYATWAQDFPGAVLRQHVTDYQATRVLPSAIVWASGFSPIRGFQLLDALALVASAALLARIAIVLAWSRAAGWAAFAAAFLGFANARHALYYPTLTDSFAFLLGMTLVWAFVERRTIVTWVVAAATMFTWPVLAPAAIAMLVLPRAETLPETRVPRWVAPLIAAATCALVVAWLVEEILHPYEGTQQWLDRSNRELWPVTIACAAATAGAAALFVARAPQTFSVLPYVRALSLRRSVLAIVASAAIVVARDWWVGHVSNGMIGIDLRAIQHIIAGYALRGPFCNVVFHVVYFGPIVLVAIMSWPRVARTCASWGPAAVIALGLFVLNAVTTESRTLNHLVPFVIVLVVHSTDWTRGRALAFAALALAWSKVWVVIDYTDRDHSFAYMAQQGPWSSDSAYVIQAIAVVVTAGLLIAAWRNSKPPPPAQ